MKQGRHIIIEDGFLYDFNHAPTKKSHNENLLEGDGFEIMYKYDVQNLTQEEIIKIEERYDKATESYRGLLRSIEDAKRSSDWRNSATENTGTTTATTGLATGTGRGQSTYAERNDGQSVRDSRKLDSIYTPSGTVFGWTQNGKIYLTPQGFNPNTLLHEYTHLWDLMVQQVKKSALVGVQK